MIEILSKDHTYKRYIICDNCRDNLSYLPSDVYWGGYVDNAMGERVKAYGFKCPACKTYLITEHQPAG